MDIERGNLEVLFNKIPFYCITENNNSKNECHDYKNVKIELYMLYAKEVFGYNSINELQSNYNLLNQTVKKTDVFHLILELAEQLLCFEECEIRCKLENLLRWREISFQLGQDIFTCAFLAQYDLHRNRKTDFFAWIPIIRSDDLRLHNILEQGVADNHFHLNGSTKIFELNWISLMNIIENRKHDFAKIEKGLQKEYSDGISKVHRQESFYEECQKAALYRVYLFVILKEDKYLIDKLHELHHKVLSGVPIQTLVADIQDAIFLTKRIYGAKVEGDHALDYAFQCDMKEKNNNACRLLSGERRFLYECYIAVLLGKFKYEQCNMFYIYLRIRTHFRGELIQINRQVGFENFSEYQNRKEIFIEGIRLYENELVKLAINEPLSKEYFKSLEARICPGDNPGKLYKKVERYNSLVDKTHLDKLSYVLHFPKSPDKKYVELQPRNYNVRKDIRKQAMCINDFLKKSTKLSDFIRGIDACSNEIGCRPEVFAQCYRYLADVLYSRNSKDDMAKLYFTYHAGEDFMDIADGLRAIDETILFCGLHRGSRIGHALALGINAYKYYEYKNECIAIEKQILLDDIAWILCKSSELGIYIEQRLRSLLEERFYYLLKEIYGHILDDISLMDYWLSCKLRGDAPEYYLFDDNKKACVGYDKYRLNKAISDKIRTVPKLQRLYRAYHYNERVRNIGNEICVFKIEENYAKCIFQLQEAMIQQLAYMGIAIETNPSSNYLIGTIKKYDEHPIIRFNSRYIEKDFAREMLNVSINTDDQGVFDTILENEYALMALALRKVKDSDGRYMYHLEDIYEWIDYVRRMGLEQVFR